MKWGEALPSDALPQSGPEPVIDGLDGQAFMDALEADGFARGSPQPFTTVLTEWTCSAASTDAEGVTYEVIILGGLPPPFPQLTRRLISSLPLRPTRTCPDAFWLLWPGPRGWRVPTLSLGIGSRRRPRPRACNWTSLV